MQIKRKGASTPYYQITNQYQFLPFAVESIGPFGDDVFKFVRLPSATGEPRETWLIQRISLAIQRGSAASVVATISPAPIPKFIQPILF
jgi:hypothetical protein